jgi:carbon-monoxide dehydrogenase small subunit
MTFTFILNGEDVSVDSTGEDRLVDILRGTFGLLGTKISCYIGKCGSCSVIYNGSVVKSCLIPALKIRNSEVITIEGFSQTDEYQDIIQGFSDAGLEACGFCNIGKVLTTEALLGRNREPSKSEILSAFQGIRCRCTDPEELVQGVMAVGKLRRQRIYGRSPK